MMTPDLTEGPQGAVGSTDEPYVALGANGPAGPIPPEPYVEPTAAQKSTYAVGDVRSMEKGSGARANNGKPNWSLMPLNQVVFLMMLAPSLRSSKITSLLSVVQALAHFQEGRCMASEVLLESVIYNMQVQKDILAHNGPGNREIGFMSSLENVIRVWEYGLIKYAEFNWAKGMPWSVATGCIMRHVRDIMDVENGIENSSLVDAESGQLHSAHIVCNAMMLVHYESYYRAGDDRPLHVFMPEQKGDDGNEQQETSG